MSDQAVAELSQDQARKIVLEWIEAEWGAYGDGKWSAVRKEQDHKFRLDGYAPEGYWFNQIFNYCSRAQVLTTKEPIGRQAAMKMATTLIDSLVSMIRVFGLPPAPGHPSGDLHEWDPETLP